MTLINTPGMLDKYAWDNIVRKQEANPPLPTHEDMLKMRMRWRTWAPKFHYMIVKQCNDTVLIWIVMNNGQHLTLTDEAGMYPSDALVTKIRLLEDGVSNGGEAQTLSPNQGPVKAGP